MSSRWCTAMPSSSRPRPRRYRAPSGLRPRRRGGAGSGRARLMTSQPTSFENLPRHSIFIDATDLEGALEALQEHGSDLTVLAGGTDVMVQYLRGDVLPRGLL